MGRLSERIAVAIRASLRTGLLDEAQTRAAAV